MRRHVLKTCRVEAFIELPEETFEPNKINVKSSVLVSRRREEDDPDSVDDYPVAFISVESLGYDGSGDEIRGFDLNRMIAEVRAVAAADLNEDESKAGYEWSGFRIQAKVIAGEKTARPDVRFWHPSVRTLVRRLVGTPGVRSIEELNAIETKRGKSPPAAEYVSDSEGYALVVKSGYNIIKSGELIVGGDYVEAPYQEYVAKKHGPPRRGHPAGIHGRRHHRQMLRVSELRRPGANSPRHPRRPCDGDPRRF